MRGLLTCVNHPIAMPHRPARPPLHDTAAWLLGRAPTASDGTPATELAAAAARLPCPVPEPLRTFYAAVGRTPALMQGFQRFAAPHEWECLGDKLLFMEENQGVCWWATDAQQQVWQTTDLDAPDWYAEQGDLETFLHSIAYYQMAQGGYPHCGLRAATGAIATPHGLQGWLQSLPAQPVVDLGGLHIYTVGPQALVWHLGSEADAPLAVADPGVFLSVLDGVQFNALCERWGFDDLG